jgi:hypothetical protein
MKVIFCYFILPKTNEYNFKNVYLCFLLIKKLFYLFIYNYYDKYHV